MRLGTGGRDPHAMLRVVLGVFLALDLIAAGFVLFPPGGSGDALEQQLRTLEAQTMQKKKTLELTRQHVAAVEKGRKQGDDFLGSYFLSTRTAYSTVLSELEDAAKQSQIKAKEHSFATEPIEGSDDLSMMTITAGYEGSYKDLMNFIHQLDRSPRLLIIESLNAAPQSNTNAALTVSMKIDTFIREVAE
jgi:Tfp pilus assembly protein PilO